MKNSTRSQNLIIAAASVALCGCVATTSTQMTPSPQSRVCERSSSALIVWAPRWRVDQKDVVEREAAASDGIAQFFKKTGCFASVSIKRVPQLSASTIQSAATEATSHHDRLIAIAIREFGPIVKIGSSLALVEGGTEVVLDIEEFKSPSQLLRSFSVHWRNGGPGVIKGAETLPQDIQSSLAAGLQPESP